MSIAKKTPRKPAEELRSRQWFGRMDRDGFVYRSWVKNRGVPTTSSTAAR